MIITKRMLKRIIKEELNSIKEQDPAGVGPEGDKPAEAPAAAAEPVPAAASEVSAQQLRGSMQKSVQQGNKLIQKINLYIKNASMKGKSHKFINKMLAGAAREAAAASQAYKAAAASEAKLDALVNPQKPGRYECGPGTREAGGKCVPG